MKKYNYLTLKTIVPTLLFILIVTFAISFFFGGLKATSVYYDNIEWELEGFVDMGEKERTIRNETGKFEGDVLESAKIVAQNENYVMILNENTTIVSVYKKLNNWNEQNPTSTQTSKIMYSSALSDGSNGEEKSNLTVSYYSSNGNLTTINSFDKSVQYENSTTGSKERYYKIRYDEDTNTVDILYTIGDFTPYIFPKQISYDFFQEKFIGNTFIYMEPEKMTTTAKVYDAFGNPIVVRNEKKPAGVPEGLVMKISSLTTISREVAVYVLEKGLGSVRSANNRIQFSEFSEAAKEEILNSTSFQWILDDVVDSEGRLLLKPGVDYNCSDSPMILNEFVPFPLLQYILNDSYEIIKENLVEGQNNKTITFPFDYDVEKETAKDIYLQMKSAFNTLTKANIFKLFYVGNFKENSEGVNVYDPSFYFNNSLTNHINIQGTAVYYDYNFDGIITEDEYYRYGGYPLRDEDGNFVYEYDEEGEIVRTRQAGLLVEEAIEQNTIYNNPDATTTVAFEICLRFTLNGSSLDVSMLRNSIKEGAGVNNKDESIPSYFKHDKLIGDITICKYLTTNATPTDEGQIILPDGSGAVISFNSQKSVQFTDKYPEKRIYGLDFAINQLTMNSMTNFLMFGMYGYLEQTKEKGVVAIVDKGAAQTAISANFRTSTSSNINRFNYAYFITSLREKESVRVTSVTSYTKTTRDLYQGDIAYKYILMDENLNYVNVANIYRNYLIEKYDMYDKYDSTQTATPTISFAGAYEKKTLKIAFVTNSEFSLTTFAQAQGIVSELVDNGVNSMNVSYYGWTKDEYDTKIGSNVKVSNVLGGNKGIKELNKYLEEHGFGFYPDLSLASGRGYDLMFGSLKYNSKSIAGSYSNAIDYVLSTGLEDSSRGRGNYISPIYYTSLMNNYLNSYDKLNISGIALNDIGNQRLGDYSKDVQLYTAGGVLYQQQVLEKLDENNIKAYLYSPFDYAFKYTTVATFVPITTTMYGIVDYSIPLYQLVCSGLFDYSSPAINYNNDFSSQWNFLKALETGSNLEYYLSASDTSVLINTRYSDLYGTQYAIVRDEIIKYNNLLNQSGIYKKRLVGHEYITDSVVKVTYKNDFEIENNLEGLVIYINYGNMDYRNLNTGLFIKNNDYIIYSKGV